MENGDLASFHRIVESRRSVRIYDGTPIPDAVVNDCIDMALLAPNSSNLQPWEFYWVRDARKRQKLVEACLSQPSAKTAAELIVVVARTGTWFAHSRQMLEHFETAGGSIPEATINYYRKIMPLYLWQGPFSIFGAVKRLVTAISGLFKPTPREPVSHSELKLWAVKSTALAAENLMLAARAHGFDSCPMEGFDSFRVRALLNLPSDALVTMIVSLGKRAEGGVYGPRFRFDRSQFVRVV